ncbi:terminase gpA endonuclease subunit [Rubinisphaera italica]|uniref:Phage terminase large subunit (GpA) n=1 Tax=Rubinisphaera italica TaxID=2527969 RepID=A0A5C5XM42_9PLAN|nr:terminase gpA endonuclease subunit [Rubinisphaera italica]TWT63185.1 Phage terminase large subunit (GpA) [Rubinisphaera italica]
MPKSYDDHREDMRRRQAEQSAEGREIGTIPKIKNKRRRARCEKSLDKFLMTYFPRAFPKKFSKDHLQVIKLIEQTVVEGGQQAVAMPRGSGKSTICIRAVMWPLLYGFHRYAMLIAADDSKSSKLLRSIKTELGKNQLLYEDFPEVIHAIRKLQGIANRAVGQTHNGKPTGIDYQKKIIIFPTIEGSKASGAILETGGITSAVRGGQLTLETGEVIRPTIVLVDDPQTRKSAKSVSQCQEREQILSADLLGMAGPGESLAALVTCTVVYQNDLADRLLNSDVHPDWYGIRTKMLEQFPTNMKLWEQYWELRQTEMIEKDRTHRGSNQFYKKNRKAMDAGAVVSWEERYSKSEQSAIQHAMNHFFRDLEAFYSEYQNEPIDQQEESEPYWDSNQIARKTNGLKRSEIPGESQKVTAFIDVQRRLLYWMVVAWGDQLNGWIVDYGTYPDQRAKAFTASSVRNTLERVYKAKIEVALRAGLMDLIEPLLAREFTRTNGTAARIDRLGIDGGWGESTPIIREVIRASGQGPMLMTCFGRGIRAKDAPMSAWPRKEGEWRGLETLVRQGKGRDGRHLLFNTNVWKSQALRRLSTDHGEAGCVSIYGGRSQRHDFLAEHLTAEQSRDITDEKTGRTAAEWSIRPTVTENHWLDTFVGNCVMANSLGIYPPGFMPTPTAKPKKARNKSKVNF